MERGYLAAPQGNHDVPFYSSKCRFTLHGPHNIYIQWERMSLVPANVCSRNSRDFEDSCHMINSHSCYRSCSHSTDMKRADTKTISRTGLLFTERRFGIWARFLYLGTAQSSDPDQALMCWFLNANQDFSSSLNGMKSGEKLKTKTKQKTRKTKELKKETDAKKRFLKKYLN